jgi:hypothetical protein
MTTSIHPKALKAFRARKHWTQEDLADATKGQKKVSLPTIKRIESTKEDHVPWRGVRGAMVVALSGKA